MFPEEIRPALQKYAQEWKAAERAIKTAEQFDKELNVASIVELRYAGRRFIEVIEFILSDVSNSCLERNERLKNILFEATQNCIRARNDAIDVIVSFANDYFAETEDRYGVAVVRSYFPEYTEIKAIMFEV